MQETNETEVANTRVLARPFITILLLLLLLLLIIIIIIIINIIIEMHPTQ